MFTTVPLGLLGTLVCAASLTTGSPVAHPTPTRDDAPPPPRMRVLTDAPAPTMQWQISPLEPLLGEWQVEGTWSWGTTLTARAVYEVGIGGRFVNVRTWVSDDGGPTYLRYEATIAPAIFTETAGARGAVASQDAAPDPDDLAAMRALAQDRFLIRTASHDGSFAEALWHLDADAQGRDRWTMQWEMGTRVVDETMVVLDRNAIAWTVRARNAEADLDDAEWSTMLDVVWRRVDPAHTPPAAIEARVFGDAGPNVRRIELETVLDAPPAEVFRAWTSAERLRAVIDPEGTSAFDAEIDLKIGGRYEWLFDENTPMHGARVLSYAPFRMLSFSWSAPPGQETRETPTWVTVLLEPVVDPSVDRLGTRVRLIHAGFGDGPEWDETHDYFVQAWPWVMERFEAAFGTE